ncbi:MAG: hypothetical protein LBE12_18720, partial [Planctomycetaceae bacterium]|nr:hypothetical protein [Planctomycetaceae bacterium]
MSRNFVLLLATTIVFVVIFCAVGSAQTSSVIYHIWDTDKLPNSSTTEKYYRYLSRPEGVSANQSGLYQITPSFGTSYIVYYNSSEGTYYSAYSAEQQANIILHNDDSTLLNQTFDLGDNSYYYYYDYYNSDLTNSVQVTIQSDTPGTLRKITGTNTSLFHLWGNSQLTISNDIIISKKEDLTVISDSVISGSYNYYNSYAGAVYLQGGALNAEGTSFSSCLNTNIINYSSGSSSTGNSNINGKGGAITADSRYYYYYYYDGEYYYYDYGYDIESPNKVINVNKAKFIENQALLGGAVYMDQYTLNGNETEFRGNIAKKDETYYSSSGNGGAIYLINSTATLENATFTNNSANGNGGAIFSENSNLYLKGTNFKSNNATGLGGAVFFTISDSGSYVLQLGAFQGTSVEFAGNKQYYDSINNTENTNSITFSSGSSLGTTGTVNVTVDVEGSGNNFNMRDSMSVIGNEKLYLRFNKTGEGAWNLYGLSDFTQASSVLFNIAGGTFRLGNDAGLNIVSKLGTEQFNVRNNATLVIGDWAGSDNAAALSTHHFQMDAGSTLLLNQTLNLNVLGNENVIKGTVTGTGDLVVNVSEPSATLKFSGQTSNYSGNLKIQSGTFWADSGFETTGSVELA